MKALTLCAPGKLRLEEQSLPEPAEGEALVRVGAVGICGSDLHWIEEAGIGDARLTRPLILGHELAGVIESGDRGGLRVAIDPAISCGRCEHCLEGNPHFCENLRFAGHSHQDGGLREVINWPERFLHPLPESLSEVDGAMLEPLGVAMHALSLAKMKVGMRVGVFGCGPIGLLIVQLARLSGATAIIATDKLPHRLLAAGEFGATVTIQAHEGEEFPEVWSATGERGVDVAFEAAGENPAVGTAIAAARPGSRVVLVGIPADDKTSFTASTARRKGLTLLLSRRMKNTYPRAVRLVERGLVDVRSLVTHKFPLDHYQEAFSIARRREGLKVVIEM
jgi:L-iditol 2-dehydrogenase